MYNMVIKEKNWKDLKDVRKELKLLTPYWLKLENGNIVLSTFINTENNSGWAETFIDVDGVLKVKGNVFYMARGAQIQKVERID